MMSRAGTAGRLLSAAAPLAISIIIIAPLNTEALPQDIQNRSGDCVHVRLYADSLDPLLRENEVRPICRSSFPVEPTLVHGELVTGDVEESDPGYRRPANVVLNARRKKLG